jgi:dephospho-CoA kinase
MRLYGLTGGIGMGKTTCAELLVDMGIPVVDTDVLARRLVEPGQPALGRIRARFGDGVLDGAGRLIRDALAALVFDDANARRDLENILHPPIRAAWLAEAARWRSAGLKVGVVVVPLLFETGAEQELDAVVCVACSRPTQRRRLEARGWDWPQTERRLAAQWSVGEKMDRSSHVVWTEGSIEVTRAQLQLIFAL